MPPRSSRKRKATKWTPKSKRKAAESSPATFDEDNVLESGGDLPVPVEENECLDSSKRLPEASEQEFLEVKVESSRSEEGMEGENGGSLKSSVACESVVVLKVEEEFVQKEEISVDNIVETTTMMSENSETNVEDMWNLGSEEILKGMSLDFTEGANLGVNASVNVNGEVLPGNNVLGTVLEDNPKTNSEDVDSEKNLDVTVEVNSKLHNEGVDGENIVDVTREDNSKLESEGVDGEKNLDATTEENLKLESDSEGVDREKKLDATTDDNSKLESEGVDREKNLDVTVVNSKVQSEGGIREKNLDATIEENSKLESEGVDREKDFDATTYDNSKQEVNGEKNLDVTVDNSELQSEGGDRENNLDATMDDNLKLDGEGVVEDDGDVVVEEIVVGENVTENDGSKLPISGETFGIVFNDMSSLGHVVNLSGNEEGCGDRQDIQSRDGEESDDYCEDSVDYDDTSEFISDSLTTRKKQKQLEIFIGGLHKAVVEEDLIEVFRKFGEVKNARIIKHRVTNKSKGFAFIRYATVEQARLALHELKDGIEMKGKCAKVSASQQNDVLYVGNICKTWTKEHVLEKFKSYGVELIEEIHLPDDPMNEGKTEGFAILEFSTHSDAMAALQRLRKPDAVFGCDRSATVAFAQMPVHPSDENVSQVTTVFVEGLTKSWDVEKLKERCKQYGEIRKVKLCLNFGTKGKDFGFIYFASQESARACVEGINNAQIKEGKMKVKANLAKPKVKGRHQKGIRGGFKISKEVGKAAQTKVECNSKPQKAEKENKREAPAHSDRFKDSKKKGKAVYQQTVGAPLKLNRTKGNKPNKPQSSSAGYRDIRMSPKPGRANLKRKDLPWKADSHSRERGHDYSSERSKKSRGNVPPRPDIREKPINSAYPVTYRIQDASGYAASASGHESHARGAIAGTKRRHSDMEPHAGYLEPVEPAVRRQDQRHTADLGPVLGHQGHPGARCAELALANLGQPRAQYREPAPRDHGQSLGRYVEPAAAREALPYAGYLGPSVRKQPFDAYGYRLRRTDVYDRLGSPGLGYQGGSALPPSYVQSYTRYTEYEVRGNIGNRSREAYHQRPTYY